jgi:dUTP pyrophosphatase
MNKVQVNITSKEGYIPTYAHKSDSGFDLRFYDIEGAKYDYFVLPSGATGRFKTGLSFDIPVGYEIQIRPRSSMNAKGIIAQFGTVDQEYRGEVSVVLTNTTNTPYYVNMLDKIAQGVISPVYHASFTKVDSLTATDRGEGGFGSTGR